MNHDTVVQLIDLTKDFGKFKAVESLNLTIDTGEVLGFVGPNGAGKTTTLRMLLGLAKPTGGDAIILGSSIRKDKNYLENVGYLPDVPAFYGWMKAPEFLRFCGEIFKIEPRKLKSKIEDLLELVGLKGEKKHISSFSRGMKQRLGLAQALINDPKVVFLDEPTSALDPIGRKEMLDTIEQIKERSTVFFSTHILSDVERVCSKVAILNNGKLIAYNDLTAMKAEYGEAVYVVNFSEINQSVTNEIRNSNIFSSVNINGNCISLGVKDSTAACKEIPRIAVNCNVGIVSMVHSEPKLEDIFIKLVGKNGN